MIFTYTAEPGSRSEEALKLLGSWTATVDPTESQRAPTKAESSATGSLKGLLSHSCLQRPEQQRCPDPP
jgi:hypothetical protein